MKVVDGSNHLFFFLKQLPNIIIIDIYVFVCVNVCVCVQDWKKVEVSYWGLAF